MPSEAYGRLAMNAGYGFGLGADRGVLTLYAGMTLGEASSRTVSGVAALVAGLCEAQQAYRPAGPK